VRARNELVAVQEWPIAHEKTLVMLLAGDVGGTKTDLAVFSSDRGVRSPLAEATLPSADYQSLEALVQEFLSKVRLPVGSASFGVAGPVVAGRAKITNLPWQIDEERVGKTLRLSRVRVVNDLDAIAHAVPLLEPGDLETLNPGTPAPGGAIAIIAPGTGLGEAFLTWDGTRYQAHPSEGGHVDFAPATARELDMLRSLQSRFGHVSYERVCSGRGLPNIYAYLRESRVAEEPAWLAEQLETAADRTPVIVEAAQADPPCALCVATLDTFVSIMGAEAGNLALKVLATGGVYVAGGIPRRILPALERDGFMQAFRRKGRFAEFLDRIPVHVVLNPKVGLMGAASIGLDARGGA
jgi:glucokinase